MKEKLHFVSKAFMQDVVNLSQYYIILNSRYEILIEETCDIQCHVYLLIEKVQY